MSRCISKQAVTLKTDHTHRQTKIDTKISVTGLEAILTKYNFQKRATRPTTTFEEIESQIGFLLPDDYKFYLDYYEGNGTDSRVDGKI